MSTALVSSFLDMNDVLHQRNFANNRSQLSQSFDQKVVGSPVRAPGNNSTRPRMNPMASVKMPAQQPLISLQEALIQTQAREQQIHPGLRKLDRSVSDPTDKLSQLSPLAQQQQQQQKNINSSRYKTELCRPFEENGYCKYGDKCQFAHGMPELRSLARHPKYKTELCRTFHTIGFCPYGPRCHFIHSEDDRKLCQISQLKQQQVVQQLSQVSQAQQQPPVAGRSASQPMAMSRPKNFPLCLPPMMRESLGSCADSPPSSVTSDSPTMSPTLLRDQDLYSGFPGTFSPPPMSAPVGTSLSAFSFQDFSTAAPHHQQQQQSSHSAPLNVQTDHLASLAAGIQAMSLKQRNAPGTMLTNEVLRDCLQDLLAGYGTHSPDSVASSSNASVESSHTCGSPLEVSRGLRLPIFSQFVNDE